MSAPVAVSQHDGLGLICYEAIDKLPPFWYTQDRFLKETMEIRMSEHVNRIVVKFEPIPQGSDASLEGLIEEIRAVIPNGVLIRPPSASGRAVFSVDPTIDVVQLANELSQHEGIEYAEPDIVDSAACDTPDSH
jgi:hypothetical protein